jgi:TolB-like protein
MNIRNIAAILVIFFISSISGCKSTKVHNIDNAQFVAPSNASIADIRDAILRGSQKAGWRAKALETGTIAASYSYKRNRFGAVVKITYDRDSYDINYHSSHNLKYNENIGTEDEEPDFFRESKDFFSENNPFSNSSDMPAATEKPATIHKIYNKWVALLETKINNELAMLGKKNLFSPRSQSTKPASRNPTECDDQPVYNTSGQGKTSRSSVNVRTGPSTKCTKFSTVSNRDTFTLLGRKNNWFYVALNNGKNGWIYAPLVSKPEESPFLAARASNPPPEPPPAPSKKISIAVIHFKTLNKEAQEIALGELVSETFTSALVNSQNFKIIEREQLDKVVKEIEMNQTGFIETTDAVEIGKMLHADAIITGSVALLAGQIQLNARIIEIESAYVISADSMTTTYTLKNINTIAHEIVGKLARRLASK